MIYYKLSTDDGDSELLAICKQNKHDYSSLVWNDRDIEERICRELKAENWWWYEISQAEFETYQAFGIKEIKL